MSVSGYVCIHSYAKTGLSAIVLGLWLGYVESVVTVRRLSVELVSQRGGILQFGNLLTTSRSRVSAKLVSRCSESAIIAFAQVAKSEQIHRHN